MNYFKINLSINQSKVKKMVESEVKQFEKYFDIVLKQIGNQPNDATFDKYEVSNIVSNIYQKTRNLIKGR